MKKNKVSRTKFFVSGRIQGGLLRRMAVYWVLYHAVLLSTMFLYFVLARFINSMSGGSPLSIGELAAQFMNQQALMVTCALALVPFITWRLICATHLIAGPLVRIQKTLYALTRGERVQRVKLRDDDLLVDLQDALNEYLVASGQIAADAPSEATPQPSAEQDNVSQNSVSLNNVSQNNVAQNSADRNAAESDGVEPNPKAVMSNQILEKLREIEEMLASAEAPDDEEYERIARHNLHS